MLIWKNLERERALTLVLLLMLVLGFVLKSHDGGKTGQLENSDDTK